MAADLVPSSPPVDLIADSLVGLLAVAFPRSRALRYPLAVELARAAAKYSESTIGGTPYHLAAFGRTQDQAARAFAIVRALRGQKAEYFARGQQLDDVARVQRVLGCYLKACACADPKAHCHRIIGDPFSTDGIESAISRHSARPPLYVWPCTFMLDWNTPRIQLDHPATPQAQVQARAVAIGCDICPNFSPSLVPVAY
ncbi:hypothetical protein [Paraburkholderia sp.]|uniref:hypothetical protein n=1 Tax=Paraburkholderia sp. TaxID=1926495 RepID=UPI003C7CCBAF